MLAKVSHGRPSWVDYDTNPPSTGTIPEPTAVLTERKRAGMRLPPPRSKSPIKTSLKSPARRNPSLGPVSSPAKGSVVAPRASSVSASVRRKLDFSNSGLEDNEDIGVANESSQKRPGASFPAARTSKLVNGERPELLSSENGDEEDQDDSAQEYADLQNGEDSLQMADGGEDMDPEPEAEEPEEIEEPAREPEPSKGAKGKKKDATLAESAAKRGRPKKVELLVQDGEESRPVKRSRESLETAQVIKNKGGRSKKGELAHEQEEERPAKRTRKSLDVPEAAKSKDGRPKRTSSVTTTNPSKPKAAGRKPKLATVSEAESPQIQRGPPMPRSNRGLFILRRETPMEGAGFKQTRSGRSSIKPLAYWKNEKVEFSEDVAEDNFGRFTVRRMKEVVRVDALEEPKRVRGKSKAPKTKKRTAEPESEEEDDATEPWELDPGRVWGDIRNWDPEDQTGSLAEETQEELALSSAAIITRDIAGATFRFAKTLTLPFFGSGMVDLPPGAMKKPKNSRKMQMVFFVFYGRVQVTVNDTKFRIGKGGMWQVPRGKCPATVLINQSNFCRKLLQY
jgi:centromere protein C